MKAKITYYVATGLLTAMMLMSAGMYFFNHGDVAETFSALGYPTYLIYPLAIAKLLGLIAIWTRLNPKLAQMAYAGFFFNFVLALTAHLAVGDGQFAGAAMALILLGTSYFSGARVGIHASAVAAQNSDRREAPVPA